MTEKIHINLPRSFSWADSFAVESTVCPLSPRYRNLSRRSSLRRLLSDEGDKENQLTPEVEAEFEDRLVLGSKELIFSPRIQKNTPSFFPREAVNGGGAPARPAVPVFTTNSLRNRANSADTIFSPRYASIRKNDKQNLIFSPRYERGIQKRKFVFQNATSFGENGPPSLNPEGEEDKAYYKKLNHIFSPRPTAKGQRARIEPFSSAQITVLDLLKN
jgi:hypothetical protein